MSRKFHFKGWQEHASKIVKAVHYEPSIEEILSNPELWGDGFYKTQRTQTQPEPDRVMFVNNRNGARKVGKHRQ